MALSRWQRGQRGSHSAKKREMARRIDANESSKWRSGRALVRTTAGRHRRGGEYAAAFRLAKLNHALLAAFPKQRPETVVLVGVRTRALTTFRSPELAQF